MNIEIIEDCIKKCQIAHIGQYKDSFCLPIDKQIYSVRTFWRNKNGKSL